jgi:hypothetical protein
LAGGAARHTGGTMKILIATLALAVGLLGSGCKELTPEDIAYSQKFNAQPTSFVLSGDKSDDAWTRALDFVNRFAGTPLQDANDTMIKTYAPTLSTYGYTITRTKAKDGFRFTVICYGVDSNIDNNNAHIAAMYIATGEEPRKISMDDCWHAVCQ